MAFKPSKKLDGIEISVIRQWNSKKRKDTIDLGIGELPWKAPLELREAGAEAFMSSNLRYTENAGLPKLRELIAEEFGDYISKNIDEKQVIVTCGVTEALSITYGAFLDEGDEVLIPEISFPLYDALAKLNRATPRTFKLNSDFSLCLEDLASKVNGKTKLVVINTPSNPTGKILLNRDLGGLADILDRNQNVHVLSDEIYSHLYFSDRAPESIASYTNRFVVVNGLSKRSSSTGARIGWIISQQEVVDQALKLHQYGVTCAPTPSQYAAIPVLEGKTKIDESNNRKKLISNRNIVLSGLKDIMDINRPEGAFFCFADISRYGKSGEVAQKILDESNVLVIPGYAFGSAGDNYIRISYAVEEDKLLKGINGIKGALA